MPPTHAHFNGSVNLADTESVMREIVSRVPVGLRRIPDGETGDRGNWILFQMHKFLQSPALVLVQQGDGGAGDYGHTHFKQPESLALQVRVLNAVSAAAGRPLSFVSFTVPQYQRAESYFAPLAELAVDPDTELNFALVPYHPADQASGTTGDQVRLIDAVLAATPGGRRDWASAPNAAWAGWPGNRSPNCWTCTRRSSSRASRSGPGPPSCPAST